MTGAAKFLLTSPRLSVVSEEVLDDPRGIAGVKTEYSGDSSRATLIELVKLPALAIDEKNGIDATQECDATVNGIAQLITLVADSVPRAQWEADLNDYVDRFRSTSTWQPGGIVIDGRTHPSVSFAYEGAKAFVCDLDELFLVIAVNPAVDTPAFESRGPFPGIDG
jgi:hypothetical protein